MAFGKTAGGLILAAALAAAAQFPVRHEHFHDHCDGVLAVDEKGVAFAGAHKHAWSWKLQDIRQLTLSPDQVVVMDYRDRSYRFTGKVPAAGLYALLQDRLAGRIVAAFDQPSSLPAWTFAVNQGTLTFADDAVTYSTALKDASRTWRYSDIDNLSSSGPFELTVTTFERGRFEWGGRKEFHFELKERLPESTYNAVWLAVQKKTGKIQ